MVATFAIFVPSIVFVSVLDDAPKLADTTVTAVTPTSQADTTPTNAPSSTDLP